MIKTDKKGKLKSKLLNSKLKLNFIYDNNSLKINDLFFRDKRLSFDGSGKLKINPFFEIILNSNIRNFRSEIFSYLDLSKFFSMKDLIQKLNSQININYKARKFSNNFINDISLKISNNLSKLFKALSLSSEFSGPIIYLQLQYLLLFGHSLLHWHHMHLHPFHQQILE